MEALGFGSRDEGGVWGQGRALECYSPERPLTCSSLKAGQLQAHWAVTPRCRWQIRERIPATFIEDKLIE